MEKSKIGEFHFVTESYLLDFQGKITIPMIGTYLLHAASIHAAERGFGYNEMNNDHRAWVLSRLAIEITRYPGMWENITLYTWIEDAAWLVTNRCFELVDSKGETFGYARSMWAAIDLNTRRPTPLDVEGLNVYKCDRSCPIEKPGKIGPAEKSPALDTFTVKYSDLDVNGHLNSIKYMEHLLDMFDIDQFTRKEITRFEISYISEGKYGMDLALHKEQVLADQYNMAICHNDKAICRAAVNWR